VVELDVVLSRCPSSSESRSFGRSTCCGVNGCSIASRGSGPISCGGN
jgi:hypothetical protein